jgi:hypothetical protein
VEAVRSLLPESNALLDRFSEKRRELIAGLSVKARNALAYQKETVATALALAGLDVAELREWQPQEVRAVSFLDGLPQARLREDQMLLNDLHNFPGFDVVRSIPQGQCPPDRRHGKSACWQSPSSRTAWRAAVHTHVAPMPTEVECFVRAGQTADPATRARSACVRDHAHRDTASRLPTRPKT